MTNSKIDKLMSRGDGSVREAYLDCFRALHQEAVHKKHLSVVRDLLDNFRDITSKLHSILYTINGSGYPGAYNISDQLSLLCYEIQSMYEYGVFTEIKALSLARTFITELGVWDDITEDAIYDLQRAKQATPSRYVALVSPATIETIKSINPERLGTTVLNNDRSFRAFYAALQCLAFWEKKWKDPFFITYDYRKSHRILQHTLLNFSSTGAIHPSSVVNYAAELTFNAKSNTGDTITKVCDHLFTLNAWQKEVAAQVIEHLMSSDSIVTLDWEQFCFVVSVDSKEELPPVSVLTKMVSKPLETEEQHYNRERYNTSLMKFFTQTVST